jgi:hypothetical protein
MIHTKQTLADKVNKLSAKLTELHKESPTGMTPADQLERAFNIEKLELAYSAARHHYTLFLARQYKGESE